MKLKELCNYCEWNHKGHCIMGNDNYRALMKEEEVGCDDFEPKDLCKNCRRECKTSFPHARVVECNKYEPEGEDAYGGV